MSMLEHMPAVLHARDCSNPTCAEWNCSKLKELLEINHALRCKAERIDGKCPILENCTRIKEKLACFPSCVSGPCANFHNCAICTSIVACNTLQDILEGGGNGEKKEEEEKVLQVSGRIGPDHQVAFPLPLPQPKPSRIDSNAPTTKRANLPASLERARINQVYVGAVVPIVWRRDSQRGVYLYVKVLEIFTRPSQQGMMCVMPYDVCKKTWQEREYSFDISMDAVLLDEEIKARVIMGEKETAQARTFVQTLMQDLDSHREEYVDMIKTVLRTERGEETAPAAGVALPIQRRRTTSRLLDMVLCLPRNLGVAQCPAARCVICLRGHKEPITLRACAGFHHCQVILCSTCAGRTKLGASMEGEFTHPSSHWFCASCCFMHPSPNKRQSTSTVPSSLVQIFAQHNEGAISNEKGMDMVKRLLLAHARQTLALLE